MHADWYHKDSSLVRFNDSEECIINNYTSKIGMGYLVVHQLEDILPLYGDSIEFYDLG